MIAIMVVLRRQWIDNERLVYPLVQVPLAMTAMGETNERWPPFFKNRGMWIGFALAATWSTLHGLHAYFPEGVQFASGADLFHQQLSIMRGTSTLYVIFRFHIFGFFYFLKTEVALSLWVFNLLANVLRGAFAILGVGNTPSLGSGHGIPHTLQVYHAMGAMLVLFLGGLWAARRHLAAVWRKAWSGDPAIDDADEILSYRAAVVILVVARRSWSAGCGWLDCRCGPARRCSFWLVPFLSPSPGWSPKAVCPTVLHPWCQPASSSLRSAHRRWGHRAWSCWLAPISGRPMSAALSWPPVPTV